VCNSYTVEKFSKFGCFRIILVLKNFSKDFHFFIKIVVFDVFIALLNFGDILCVKIFPIINVDVTRADKSRKNRCKRYEKSVQKNPHLLDL
jgi:hypothetical protein